MDTPFQAVLRLQLKQLHQLVAIAETGSIRAAARRLLIAQPALSRSLRAMESDLGFALFQRSSRGIAPTPYAQVLVQYARLMDATLKSAAQEIRGIQGAEDRIARFGIGPFEGYSVAHRAVDRILHKHPDIRVAILQGGFEELKPSLLRGDIDFIFGPGPREPEMTGILDEVLAYLRPQVVVRASHPLARRKKLTLADLAGADWILPARQHLARVRFDDVFLRDGLLPPTPRIEAPSPSPTSVALTLAHDLVALLPSELIAHQLRNRQLRALPVQEHGFDVALYLTVRAGSRFSPVCRDLIAELRACCREVPGRTLSP